MALAKIKSFWEKHKFTIIYFLTFLFSSTTSYLLLSSKPIAPTPTNTQQAPPPTLPPSKTDDGRINILLLGYGGAGHDGGYLTDVIIIASISPVNKTVTLISIPRDLWAPIPIRSDKTQYFKINAAYAIGNDDNTYALKEPVYKGGQDAAAKLTKEVIKNVTGLEIDYYLTVSFSGFEDAVNTLGPISVDVPVEFDDYFYPVKGLENETCNFSSAEIDLFHRKYSGFELEKQFTCRYEHLHFDKGINEMDGQTALKFVRSRHSSQHGGDFARSQRQQAVIKAVKNKLLQSLDQSDLSTVYEKIKSSISTDIDTDTIASLIGQLPDYKSYTIKNLNISEENVLISSKSSAGAYILIPREGAQTFNSLKNYINDNI